MADISETWKRNEPDSPCVNICLIHPDEKICIGCFRTVDEISSWTAIGPAKRADIRTILPGRAVNLKPKRRGGSGRRKVPKL